MIKKLQITKIYRSDKDKEGKPLKTKDGRPYRKISIKTKEYGDKWITGFESYWNEDWVEGLAVMVDVEQNGDFLNMKKIDPIKLLEERVLKLEQMMAQNQGEEEVGGHVEDKMPF